MKALLQRYTAYNLWAHHQIFDALKPLSPELFNTPLNSSFPGIQATLLHIWDAESIWWQRLKLQEQIVVPSLTFNDSPAVLERKILTQAADWAEWVRESQEIQLQHTIQYQDRKGHPLKIQVSEIIQHVVNHTSYHRGQVITLMRQVGLTKIPQTDFGFYVLQKR